MRVPHMAAASLLVAMPLAASAADLSLFGIALGADAEAVLPECIFTSAGGWKVTNAPCQRNKTGKAWGANEHDVELPNKPDYLRSLHFASMNGKVVAVLVATMGERVQDDALAALVAKFGKPTATGVEPLQNAFGAQVRSRRASWKLPTATLKFTGVAGDMMWGHFALESQQYTQAVDAWRRSREAGQAKP